MAATHPVTSFRISDVPRGALGPVFADYLALERLKILRRILFKRAALVAIVCVMGGRLSGMVPPFALFVVVAVIGVIPAAAWIAELRAEMRLARRLSAFPQCGLRLWSPQTD